MLQPARAWHSLVPDPQHDRILRLRFPNDDGPSRPLLVNAVRADEALSRDCRFEVDVMSDDAHIVLKSVLGSAYPGLDETGWAKLTRTWALFFGIMAVVIETVWRNSSDSFWVGFKLWGARPATLLFALANVPMLMRHGLTKDEAVAVSEPAPVE